MPSYSVSASEIKYASGSSWTSGKARQGVYSSTRYEGALNFVDLANFSFSNIAITGIQMRVTFGPTGGSSTKYLTLYGGAKNSISGSIASMRGSALGAVSVSNAFDRTVTLNFNSGSEAAIYNTLVKFFTSGNRVLILYVPKTRGTYSGGYCYDYLSVTAMTLTFTYEYLQSSGSMASASVAAGSAANLNITAYSSAYSHRVTWKFGTYSNVQTIAAGVSSASYTIPLNWLKRARRKWDAVRDSPPLRKERLLHQQNGRQLFLPDGDRRKRNHPTYHFSSSVHAPCIPYACQTALQETMERRVRSHDNE